MNISDEEKDEEEMQDSQAVGIARYVDQVCSRVMQSCNIVTDAKTTDEYKVFMEVGIRIASQHLVDARIQSSSEMGSVSTTSHL